MDALQSFASTQPAPADSGALAKSGANAALSSDFETFLRMLTVQLKNQDPLNPVEASDYAVQLATFSGVEQQVKANDQLARLNEQMQLLSLSQYASWVGMEARHDGTAAYHGRPITVQPEFQPGADEAWLIVRDETDTVINRIPISVQEGQLDWLGADMDGNTVAWGDYGFFVESTKGGASLGVVPISVYSPITEVRVEDGQPVLNIAGGRELAPDDISALRYPSA